MKIKNLSKVWPIIEADDRIPLPPVAWAALNVIALVVIAVPFALLVGIVCVSLSSLNHLHVFLYAHFTHALTVSIVVNTLKVFIALIAFRFASIVADTLPWVVREGRAVVQEYGNL